MSDSTAQPRRYRFPPLVRSGLFGAMPTSQVLVLVVGGGLSFVGILLRIFPWSLVPVAIAAVVAFKRVGGWPLHELVPLKVAWLRRRNEHVWFRPVPLLPLGGLPSVALPPAMQGLRLLDVESAWPDAPTRLAGVGVVHDVSAGLLTAALRVSGDGQFTLTAAATQDVRVSLWGDALAAFCRERATVCRIMWQEWSTSTAVDPEVAPLDGADGPLAVAAADYADLVAHEAPRSVEHDIVVSLTLDIARVPARRTRQVKPVSAGLQMLLEDLRLFGSRLESAGLTVSPGLTPAELTLASRRRSNPFAETQHDALGVSLAAGLGVGTGDLAPMAVGETWEHVRVDRAIHRSWWVEGWPRSEVPALWMDMLLLGAECTRTVTLVFEPISPSQAARAVDEASVALESAEAAKSKRGFRVRASERRMRDEVERREHELVAGHGELAYCGLVTVSAGSLAELDDAGADFEQVAVHAGVQLRPLEGRHGEGWVASLPLGRTLTARRGS